MNANVINGVVRAIVPAALAYAVGKGWITQSDVTNVTAALVTLISAGWSVVTNLESKGAN